MKAFLALLKIDLKLATRNRAVLFFNYFFPLIFFFIFGWPLMRKQGQRHSRHRDDGDSSIGILGNGLFGAGMRAVQEREENILRRYKVTPITPVPLLAASMITGVILYLPAVMLMLLLAHSNLWNGRAAQSALVFRLRLLGAVAFRSIGLIIAAVVNSSQESNILIQPIYMAMLFLSGATIPTHVHAELAADHHAVHSRDLSRDRHRRGILQRGETFAQNWKSVVALVHHRVRRNLHRDETVSLGEGRETARLGQALGLGRVAAVSSFSAAIRPGAGRTWSRRRSSSAISRAAEPG